MNRDINDNNCEIKFKYRRGGDIDLVDFYLKQAGQYPLLSAEEEVRLGRELKLINKIKIITPKRYKNSVVSFLDLEKVFLSIDNDLDREYIVSVLEDYLFNSDRTESINDKVMGYYLDRYNKLYNKLGRCPSVLELNDYFSNCSKYRVFNNFYIEDKMDSCFIKEQVKMYVRYMRAFNTMVNSNLRLVVKVAKGFYGTLEFNDLIEEGNLGLMKAVREFDIDKGCRFSTFGVSCIKTHLIREIDNKCSVVRIPIWKRRKILEFNKSVMELENKVCRSLTDYEIAEMLRISIDEVLEYRLYGQDVLSLDSPVNCEDDENLVMGDFIRDDYDAYEDRDRIEDLRSLRDILNNLSNLTEQEKIVINLRFGLVDGKSRVLEEIGKELGVTRERIRQVESNALKKIKPQLRRRGFDEYL